MKNKHTLGSWKVDHKATQRIVCNNRTIATSGGSNNTEQEYLENIANANLIAAAPDMHNVCNNFEIQYKEGDGDYWLILHGNGTTGKGGINLGKCKGLVGQVLKLFEEDRKKAIAKAKGEL